MRVLHTGDWHVGRALRGRHRAEEHEAVLDEIVSIAAEREVDLVIVAGDLFDVAAPSPEAERIVYRALLGLAQTGAAAGSGRPVVVIAGNHDNPHRLSAVRPVLEKGCGVSVRSFPAAPEKSVLTFDTGAGRVQVACLPFLSQRTIVRADELMSTDQSDQTRSYQDRAQDIIGALAASMDQEAVRILTAHLTIFEAKPAGSERGAHTGFDYGVSPGAFPGDLHYVALGHFHRPQAVPAACPVRYCGSPLQLDFGEAGQTKVVLLVDAEPGRPADVEEIPLSRGRQLRDVRGSLEQLAKHAAEVTGDFLRVIVDEAPRHGLADEVRELFPDAVDIRVAESPVATGSAEDDDPDFLHRSEVDLYTEFLDERDRADDEALVAYFKELLEAEHGGAA